MHLRETFNLVPELYAQARPRYPAALYDCIAEASGVGPGARVLEVAPATGIATVELARRGYRVTAVEMGAALAAVARKNLAWFPGAHVEVSRFEDWPVPPEPFDLVCCATAFTWLDPATRLDRCATLLRPGGFLAIWDTLHVDGGTSQFFVDTQDCYERWMPGTKPGERMPRLADVPLATYAIDAHPEFVLQPVRDFPVEIAYTTESYLELLRTYSGHIALAEENARGLYGCIARLMAGAYGGEIVKAYAFRLLLARRV